MHFKKNLIIYSNSSLDSFGLGDYLRLISFLPNLKFKKIIWIGDKKTLQIVKFSDHINSFINVKKFNYKRLENSKSQVIDLVNKKKNSKNIIYLKNSFKSKKNIKQNTFNIFSYLKKNLQIKKAKIFSNIKKKNNNKNTIFLNWIVPKSWKIKSMPLKDWKILKNEIQKKTKYKNIIFQNRNDSIKKYFNKIKKSDVIISIVGLGCHIAILFNKPLILLTGPTFFKEAKEYSKSQIIKTQKHCKVHKKKLNINYINCNCMKYISNSEIIKNLNL